MGGAGGVPYTVSADDCTRDEDCGALEYCAVIQTNSPTYYECSLILPIEPDVPDYARVCLPAGDGCVTDADCGSAEYCSCGSLVGTCVQVSPVAGCRTHEDCGEGDLCVRDARSDNFAEFQLACQLPGDECAADDDCESGHFCGLRTEEGRACQQRSVCGRPFLVHGVARLAVRTKGSDWPSSTGSVILPEGPELRASLAEHFTRVGLMEHASIAAFARLTLQLLSLGAPAELIEASLAAQGDETRHARLAFAIATAHAGESVGPGALTLEGAFENASWESIFEATVREGCIGETRAALEAHSAAAECEDPIVAEILRGIAADESQHASLAWRVATWMLEQKPELASLARALFAQEESFPEGESYRPEGARAFGVLSAEELKTSWSQSRKEVIVPCARALLSKTDRPSRNLLVAVEAARS